MSLTDKCVIRIYTLFGLLVDTIKHVDKNSEQAFQDFRTVNNEVAKPELYFQHVGSLKKKDEIYFIGKFAVVQVTCLNLIFMKIYKNIPPMKKTILILLLLALKSSLIANSIEGNKVPNSRIKMLNGKYAKLSEYYEDGPVIINFWTTW